MSCSSISSRSSGKHDATAVVEALDVRAGDADVNAADHDVALRLRIDDRLVHAFHGRLEIDDLAFAHAARRRLAHAENLDRAVGPAFAHHDANFRGANFETNHEITACHFAYSFLPAARELPCGSAAKMRSCAASPPPARGSVFASG